MKKLFAILLIVALTACNTVATKEGNSVKRVDVKQITAWKIGAEQEKKVIQGKEANRIAAILEGAKANEVTSTLPQAEYMIQVNKGEKKEETYSIWLYNEDRKGWLKKEGDTKHVFILAKEETEQLQSLLSFSPPSPPSQNNSLQTVTKKDLQITKFLIQAKGNNIHYTIKYKISELLYKQLEQQKAYYFQLHFPPKIQSKFGNKSSAMVVGEPVENDYKEYEIHVEVPMQGASSSQVKAMETYYDQYDLSMFNASKSEVGIFKNIIEIVKEYGEKMERER